MNARIPNLRIVSPSSLTSTVNVYGFDMECDFEYDAGEHPIFWPTERAHPGTPPNAELLACRVGGIDITEMLTSDQRAAIEVKLIRQMEGS
jgi:hypothetical protein